jgi:hypothetical protein
MPWTVWKGLAVRLERRSVWPEASATAAARSEFENNNGGDVNGNYLFLPSVIRATGDRPGTLSSDLFCGPGCSRSCVGHAGKRHQGAQKESAR